MVGFQLFMGNKVFWQTICRLRGKSLSTATSIKDLTANILKPGLHEPQLQVEWIVILLYPTVLNNIVRTITKTKKLSHVMFLYKKLNFLKLKDVYKL